MKVLACIFLVSSSIVFGQEVAQISGAVTDQTGAVVPDVEVTAIQVETGAKRTVRTDTAGFYVIPNLPLGPYRLEATKMGFRTFVETGIVLQVGTNPNIPVTLAVGSTSEQVEVEANAN